MDLIKDKKLGRQNQIHILLGSGQYSIHRIYEDGIAGFKPDDAQNVFEKNMAIAKEWRIWQRNAQACRIWRALPDRNKTNSVWLQYSITGSRQPYGFCTVILNGKKIISLDATEDNIRSEIMWNVSRTGKWWLKTENIIFSTKFLNSTKNRNLEQHSYTAKSTENYWKDRVNSLTTGEPKRILSHGIPIHRTTRKKNIWSLWLTVRKLISK